MPTQELIRERPILFSAPMVRAILDGRKTQTRRIVKPPVFRVTDADGEILDGCRYGSAGDRLWVRERFCKDYHGIAGRFYYRADLPDDPDAAMTVNHAFGLMRWQPSIHMPRAASRITLEVTSVRIEKLKEISNADAIAEGIRKHEASKTYGELTGRLHATAVEAYADLWDSINGRFAWASNPEVWVVSFKRVSQ